MDRIIDMAADKIFYYFGGLAIALIVSLLLIFKSEVPQSYTIPIAVASGVFIIVPIIIFIIISIKKDDRGKFLGILLNIWSIIIVVLVHLRLHSIVGRRRTCFKDNVEVEVGAEESFFNTTTEEQ